MSFRVAFERTLIEIARTRELLSLAVLSVLLYAFYYPAPYARQDAIGMPLVVVDQSRTPLSRDLIRALDATQAVDVVAEAPDMASARDILLDRRADGILVLSGDLDRMVANPLAPRPGAGAALILNTAYFVRAESIGGALAEVLADAAKRRGGAALGRGATDPAALVRVQPLFNTTSGYRDYVFPAIANIILQQTLMFTAARLAAERRRRGAAPRRIAARLGTWAALVLVGMLGQAFVFGFAFWVQDVPRGGNMAGLLLAMPLFAGAVAALGLAIGGAMRSGDDALKLLMPTSLPLVFLAGFAWPLDQMPGWLATLAWVSPGTPAMHLFVRFNQMGATIGEAAGPMAVMAGLCAAYLALALWTGRPARVATAD